jgi:hypothetical protein
MIKILCCLAIVCLLGIQSNANDQRKLLKDQQVWGLKTIDIYFTSNGVTVHIVGNLTHNLSFSTWTFQGTVTITGPGIDITLQIKEKFNLYRMTGDGRKATEVYWNTGDSKADAILNSRDLQQQFLEYVNANEY